MEPGARHRETDRVRAGGVLMTVVGAFAVFEGVLALVAPGTYATVLAIGLTGWAWVHLVLGVLVAVTGLALLRDEVTDWARVAGITVVSLIAVVQLAWLPAAPVWSILVIALCLLVLRALVVTAGAFAVGR